MQGIYRGDEANLLAFNSALAGAGLKPEHATEVLGGAHAVDFFEVHAENYMGDAVRLIACSPKFVRATLPEIPGRASRAGLGSHYRDGHQMIGRNGAPFTAISAATKPGRFLQANGLVSRSVDDSHGYNDVTTISSADAPDVLGRAWQDNQNRAGKSPAAFRFVRAGRVMARA